MKPKIGFLFLVFSSLVFALDTGTGGYGTTGYIGQNINDLAEEAYGGAYYSNGRLVLAGYAFNGSNNDFAAIRVYADGTLDTTWGSAGQVTTDMSGLDDVAYGVAIDTFGRVMLAGKTLDGTDYDFGVVRYGTDGVLDTKWGSAGQVKTDFGASEADVAQGGILINSVSQVLVGGWRDTAAGGTALDFAIARYNTNGVLDTKWNTTGMTTTPIMASTNDFANMVYWRTDNRIHLIGRTKDGSAMDFAVVRYNTAGTLDTSWGSAGIVNTDFSSFQDQAWTATFDGALNRLYVVGESHTGSNFDLAVIRYNTNGSLSTIFQSAGKNRISVVANQDDYGRGAIRFGSGQLLVVGHTANASNNDFFAVRIHTNGALDTNYDTDGKYTADMSARDDNVYSAAWDGAYYLAGIGSMQNASNLDFAAYRVSAVTGLAKSGNLNGYFWGSNNSAGAVAFDFGSDQEDKMYDIAFHTDNRIFAVGSFASSRANVARLTVNGSLDLTWGSSQGYLDTGSASGTNFEGVFSLIVDLQNRAKTAGDTSAYSMLYSFQTNGVLDTKFNGGFAGGNYFSSVQQTTAIQFWSATNRSYVISKNNSYAVMIARINSDGSVDSNFGSTTGYATFGSMKAMTNHTLFERNFSSDGKLYICGPNSCGGFVARMLTSGVLDSAFASAGLLQQDAQAVLICAPDQANRIVLIGQDNSNCAIWRYQSNGVIDTSFGSAGNVLIDWASGEDVCSGGPTQSGKIAVGGYTDSDYQFRYSRVLSNGALDAPFHSNPATVTDYTFGSAEEMTRSLVDGKDMLWIFGDTYASSAASDWMIQSVFP